MGDGGLEWGGAEVVFKSGRRDVGLPGGVDPGAAWFVRRRVIRWPIRTRVGISHFAPNMCCGYCSLYLLS